MGDYYVCSDNIDGNENSRIEALCKALEKAGHTATNGGIGPNTIQSHGQDSSSSGQIGVFICGGVDIQVFWDFVQGIGSYYHYKRFIYVYASDTATSDTWLTCNGAKNTPTVQAHDDNYSGGQGDAIGKTVHQYCTEHKDKIWYACGKLGCTFDEVIQNFLAGIGAGEEKGESEPSTIKEAIKEVIAAWDGEVEAYVRDMTMYIHKIKLPEQDCYLMLSEGLNIEYNSVTIKDYCPNNTNKLVVHWGGGDDIIIQDNKLIERFGEKTKELEATKKVLTEEAPKKEEEKKSETDDTTSDSTKKDDKTETTDNTKGYEEVPVETEEEAIEFAHIEWNKCKRESCHEIELSTIGGDRWEHGRWARVFLPSFDIDDFYYISRVSENISPDEWKASLTLVPYPPQLSEEKEEESKEEEEETTDDTENTTDTTANTNNE